MHTRPKRGLPGLDSFRKLARLRGQRRRIFRRVLNRRGKREIDGVVREAQGLLCVILLRVRDGERRHLLRGFERPHIDGVRGDLLRLAQSGQPPAVIRPVARQHHSAQDNERQHGEPGENCPFVALHRVFPRMRL
jgi:hypothetical protein